MLTVAALYHFAPLPDPAALRAPLLALCDADAKSVPLALCERVGVAISVALGVGTGVCD